MLLFKSGFTLTHILAMNECICVLVSEAFTTDAQIYASTHGNKPELNYMSDSKPYFLGTAKQKIHLIIHLFIHIALYRKYTHTCTNTHMIMYNYRIQNKYFMDHVRKTQL